MKKLIIGVLASVALLSGCATTGGADSTTTPTATSVLGDIGTTLFTQTVDNTCRSQLNAQNIYNTVTAVMTAEQKKALEDNVCGCVAAEAPKSVSMTELAQAATSSSARTQIVGKAVTKTLGTCAQKMFGLQTQ